VFLGFILTIASIALVPVVLFFDGAIAQVCITALSAAALGMAALQVQPEQLDHLRSILLRFAILALLPSVWMLVQILPLGIFGFEHPIWSSTSTALGTSRFGSLSVDPGTTLIALGRYAGFVALGLAVSMMTSERRNAEWTLFALLAVSATIALLALVRPNMIVDLSRFTPNSEALSSVPTIVAIGCIISAAIAVRAYERSETRKQGPNWLVLTSAIPGVAIGGLVFFLCLFALFRIGTDYTIAATGVGVGIFAALSLIRRLGFGIWGMATIAIALMAIAFAVFSQADIVRSTNPLLAFVHPEKSGSTELAARMLADARWSGIGAGNFAELAQLYQGIDEGTANMTTGPSSVAIIAIELGRPALIFIGIGIVILTITLLQATIKRGRDSFFPAAGAASILILSITAFGDHALLTSALAILASVIIGLALAQSLGRSTRR
jgi:hypothetical protein